MSHQIFDFSKDYVLENNRVLLKPLTQGHYKALAILAQSAEIWTYFLEKGLGKTAFERYFQDALAKRNKIYPFVVVDKTTNTVAGMTRLYDSIPDLGSIKMGHTWYGTDFQGTGINKHCKYLLFQFAFESLGLERIGFGVHGENSRSLAALKSVGCSQEGVLRNFLPNTQGTGRVDLVHYSILREEWHEAVKEMLFQKLSY